MNEKSTECQQNVNRMSTLINRFAFWHPCIVSLQRQKENPHPDTEMEHNPDDKSSLTYCTNKKLPDLCNIHNRGTSCIASLSWMGLL